MQNHNESEVADPETTATEATATDAAPDDEVEGTDAGDE